MNNEKLFHGIIAFSGVLILVFLLVIRLFTEINFIISTIAVILIFILLIWIYKIIDSKSLKKVDLDYVRDIPNKYDLPTVAFLYNNKVRIDPLVAAFKLKLKRLDIIDNEEKIINQVGVEKLSDSEKYLFNLLYFNKDDKYSVLGFNNILYTQLNKIGFSSGYNANHKYALILFFLLFLGGILGILCSFDFITFDEYKNIITIFVPVMIVLLVIGNMLPKVSQYTKLSKEERKNIVSFYNFLKDFSLLDEKKMTEYPLWKEYLEFAVLFGINKNYTIENINLITTDEFLGKLEELGKDQ